MSSTRFSSFRVRFYRCQSLLLRCQALFVHLRFSRQIPFEITQFCPLHRLIAFQPLSFHRYILFLNLQAHFLLSELRPCRIPRIVSLRLFKEFLQGFPNFLRKRLKMPNSFRKNQPLHKAPYIVRF